MNNFPNRTATQRWPAPGRRGFDGWRAGLPGSIRAVLAALILLGASGAVKAGEEPGTNTMVLADGIPASNTVSRASVTNHVNVLDDQYRLAIGDQLSFRILEDEDDPKIIVVTDSGDLQVPYIGRYPAIGKTCKELAEQLKLELEKEYYLQATVIIAVDSKPKSRGKVYLVGAIGAPGPQDISGDEVLTVSKAVLRAGGLTSFADGKDVKVTRSVKGAGSEEKTMVVNVSRIFEKGKTEEDVPLQPGDLIYVPERVIRF